VGGILNGEAPMDPSSQMAIRLGRLVARRLAGRAFLLATTGCFLLAER